MERLYIIKFGDKYLSAWKIHRGSNDVWDGNLYSLIANASILTDLNVVREIISDIIKYQIPNEFSALYKKNEKGFKIVEIEIKELNK